MVEILVSPGVSKTAPADQLFGQGNFDVAGPRGQAACRRGMEVCARVLGIFKELFCDPQISIEIQDDRFR
jgi:hypothetical protein